MESMPSSFAVAVHKIFERLESKKLSQHLNQSKHLSRNFLFDSKCNFIFFFDSVEDKDLLELSGIFGDLLPEALDIIDFDRVTIHKDPSQRRQYIEIIEDQNTISKLLPNINYCTCPTFHEKVIKSNELYTCKHVLAFKLAILTNKFKERTARNNDAFWFSIRMIKPMSTISAD